MEAQELTELIERLIDKKIQRSQIGGKNVALQQAQNQREIEAIKTKLVELLQPLFT